MNRPTRDDATEVVIGVDIGGTATRFIAMDRTGVIVGRRTSRTPRHFEHDDQMVDFFRMGIEAIAPTALVTGVGVGASGPVDAQAIRNPDTLPAFTDRPLTLLLEAAFDAEVVLDNDAIVAAVAEHRVGAARGSESLLQVTLGTGIGTALLVQGRPWRGGDGRHPEGGHVSTSVATAPCYCGRAQCWEQAASRSTLQAAAAQMLGRRPTDPDVLPEAIALAGHGDETAAALFADYGRSLADGLATLLELYRPTDVVLGGSAAAAYAHFEAALRAALLPLGSWLSAPRIHPSALDDTGGAIGAALLLLPLEL